MPSEIECGPSDKELFKAPQKLPSAPEGGSLNTEAAPPTGIPSIETRGDVIPSAVRRVSPGRAVAMAKSDEPGEVRASVGDTPADKEPARKPQGGLRGKSPEEVEEVLRSVYDANRETDPEKRKTIPELAAAYDVTEVTIQNWLKREREARGDEKLMGGEEYMHRRGEIYDLSRGGMTYAQIAERYDDLSMDDVKTMIRGERKARGDTTRLGAEDLASKRASVWEQSTSTTNRKTYEELARQFNVSEPTIGRWIKQEQEIRRARGEI